MIAYGASDMGLLILSVFVSEFILVLGIEQGAPIFQASSVSVAFVLYIYTYFPNHCFKYMAILPPNSQPNCLVILGAISWQRAHSLASPGTQCPLSTLPGASSNTNNPLGPCVVHFTDESGFALGIQLGWMGLWVSALCGNVQQLYPTSTHGPSFLTM